jgi:hypothetical protein
VTAPPPEEPSGRHGWRWAVAAGLAGVAASTLATALAAAVAGRQSDLALQPVELALRVGLLLVAPCVGAVLAAVVVPARPGREAGAAGRTPPGAGRLAVVAVGLGVPIGPLLVLRLDRMRDFGLATALLTVGVMITWGVVGSVLAAGWWARPGRQVERTDLPPLASRLAEPRPAGAEPSDHLEASGDPGPRGPAA